MVLDFKAISLHYIIEGLEKVVSPRNNAFMKLSLLESDFDKANRKIFELSSLVKEYFSNVVDMDKFNFLISNYTAPFENQAHTTFSILYSTTKNDVNKIIEFLREQYYNRTSRLEEVVLPDNSASYQIQPAYRR